MMRFLKMINKAAHFAWRLPKEKNGEVRENPWRRMSSKEGKEFLRALPRALLKNAIWDGTLGKMRPNKGLVDLGPFAQEKKILYLLFENKVMTRAQIKELVFPTVVKSRVSKVICGLMDKNLVEVSSKQIEPRKHVLVYSLSESGKTFVSRSYPVEIHQEIRSSQAVFHDLKLVEIRRAFEARDSVAHYLSENVLQCCEFVSESEDFGPMASVRCDAVVGIQTKSEVLYAALEYEPTPKSFQRYKKKLLEYYLKPNIRFVIYISESDWLVKHIRKAELNLGQTLASKIFFVKIDDLLNLNAPVTFFGKDGNNFQLAGCVNQPG